MTVLHDTQPRRNTRPAPRARRFGYLVAVFVNLVLLLLIHGAPGWRTVGFLTADTPAILPWVTASLAAGVTANAVYLLSDPPRLVALGGIVTTSIGLGAQGRIWEIFRSTSDRR